MSPHDQRSAVRHGRGGWTRIDRLPERCARLLAGLVLFGVSLAFMVASGLGLGPWDVLHEGIARSTTMTIGSVVIVMSAVVLLLWLPLRERPGIGTVANMIIVGLVVDATLLVLPDPQHVSVRVALLASGIVLNGVATGLYIGAGLGPGPRDGLMTGIARWGYSIGLVRTTIEIVVLAIGWVLGGTVGIGTVLYAASIGPLAHRSIPALTMAPSDV